MFCQAGTNDSSFLWHYTVLIHTEWICASKILWLFSESQSAKNKFSPSRYQLFPASSCTTLHLYHLFFIRSDSMRLPIPLLYRKNIFTRLFRKHLFYFFLVHPFLSIKQPIHQIWYFSAIALKRAVAGSALF